MKVSVSVGGRFHGFNMAQYFHEKGLLHQLVTGYPKMTVNAFGIPQQKVLSIYINEIINRVTNKLGLGYPLNFYACELYDFFTALTIKKDSDVYFIWSGYGLKTIKAIKRANNNAKIILVRGSAHILDQENLLQKISESQKQQIDSRMVNKELKEYEACDYITVPSTFAYESFISRGISADKLFLNLLGVDLKEFPYKEKKVQQKVNVGYVGVISQQKDVKGIISAIAMLNEGEDRFVLHLAGDIDLTYADTEFLKKYNFINYVGKLPQSQLHEIYNKIDVFVLNSVQDGFGMVILQAMSSGCAIIATTNTGGPDVIKSYENGIIIPAMDNNSLRQALMWFYKNKQKIPEMGSKNREISETGFTWDDFGKRNIEFIKKISRQ